MNRREFLEAGALSAAAVAVSESSLFADTPVADSSAPTSPPHEIVDFGYAFAPPHRMTIARPGASEKTLLDLEPGLLTVSWTYDDLRKDPLVLFDPPQIKWRIKIESLLDGKPFVQSRWKRGEEFLPMLDNQYSDSAGTVKLEAIGGAIGALVRVTMKNSDSRAHRFSLVSEVLGGWINHNPAWIKPGEDPDSLVAGAAERPDRVLLFGVAAAEFPVDKNTMTLEFTLPPGETKTCWLVRPYVAYQQDLAELRKKDWSAEFEAAKEEWRTLLARSVSIQFPDDSVRNAFYACLGDLFIMREPLASGYTGMICGTEVYRDPNPFDCSLGAIALEKAGFHAEAANGLRVHLDMQEPDGNWADPKGWAHHMWGASGMKAWAAMEHYKLTGDRAYLQALFPRLAASSRWQELQRQESRTPKNEESATYGLMPRGMGDGGLMNGDDYFGVFYPHNILAVFADALSVEAAGILGEPDTELRRIHETALNDLRASLKKGSIREDGFQWIPGSPANTAGSRWGTLYALYPTRILEADDPLVTGTLKKMEFIISPGGQPVHTGWMVDGTWVAISLDNLAETHLVLGQGDTAIAYLYSTLNHGTPLHTWCEERGLEPGAKKTSGDRQHLWTPVAVVRFLRDALVMEQPDGLHLGLATARSWLTQGKTVGVREAPTYFGNLTYKIESDVDNGAIRSEIAAPDREPVKTIVLHLRHPQRKPMLRVTVNGAPSQEFDAKNELVRISQPKGTIVVKASY
jgi:hypothetical protein